MPKRYMISGIPLSVLGLVAINTAIELVLCASDAGAIAPNLRNMAYRKVVAPTIIGTWMSSPKHLPILAGIPMAIFAFIWMIRAALVGTFFPLTEDGKIVYVSTINP